MKKINWNSVGIFVGQFCGAILSGFALGALRRVTVEDMDHHSSVFVSYADAVDAIMGSSMFSSDKRDAIESLPRNGDVDLYKAIVHIVKKPMWSSDKAAMIKNLSKR